MKKVIVFGGSGFLGSHVSDKLSDFGHSVTIFDLKKSHYLKPSQQMILGDIMDEAAVDSAVKGKDVVFNFAGYADLDTASTDPLLTTKLNVIGNMHILQAAVREKIEQFVYASTIYVYSESGGFYRCSKQASEIYLEEFSRKYGLNYTILRYGTLYGPRSDERNSIFRYIKSALEKGSIDVSGSGNEIREYIHVRDAAKLTAKIMSEHFFGKRFIITGHQAIPMVQMLEMIKEIVKKPVVIRFIPEVGTDHYRITPYSFIPKIGEKFAPDIFTDMGQGLIECMAELFDRKKEI